MRSAIGPATGPAAALRSSTSSRSERKLASACRRYCSSCHLLYASTAATTAAPTANSPSCRSLMSLSGRLAFFPQLQRFADVDRHHARYALLLHRHADELVRHLHGDLVVADEQELRLARHLLHQLAEALGIGVVERRVDLVEQAERRRVELEEREHQGDRRQRLLAARQQVDAGVLLARGARDDLHAAVQDLLAGHDQPRLAAR